MKMGTPHISGEGKGESGATQSHTEVKSKNKADELAKMGTLNYKRIPLKMLIAKTTCSMGSYRTQGRWN